MKAHPFRDKSAEKPSEFHRFPRRDDRASTPRHRVELIGESILRDDGAERVIHSRLLFPQRVEDFDSETLRHPYSNRDAKFVLIQFCELDDEDRRAIASHAYRECLIRHVKMARQIGLTPILVTPVRMRAYTPAGEMRQSLSPYALVMRQVAAETKASFVDLKTRSGELREFVGKELSNQLHNSSRCLIFYSELGIKRLLSWWYACAGEPSVFDGLARDFQWE
jgi:hypothetical protein